MSSAIIVIPIYKPKLTENEIISLKQCFKIFRNEKLAFITFNELDHLLYDCIAKECKVHPIYIYFDSNYFNSLESYNSLMLSKSFYSKFQNYQYLLIYQTDSYVFRNELKSWIDKQYDYIGAPWVKKAKNKIIFDGVGNGGFSLRKTNSFIRVLESNPEKIIKSFSKLVSEYWQDYSFSNFILKTPLIIYRSIGYKNTFGHYLAENSKKEDIFWGLIAPAVLKDFKIPDPVTALKFAFEKEPEWCYKMNNKNIPFGTHAWQKYSINFWNNFIDH
jgi:hypothetical protein